MSYRSILSIVTLGLVFWTVSLVILVQAATASLQLPDPSSKTRYWLGTSNGVSLFEGQTWTTYTTTYGLASNTVRAIASNLTGEQWVEILAEVNRCNSQTKMIYKLDEGLTQSEVQIFMVRGHQEAVD